MVNVGESEAKHHVDVDASGISEPKERVVGVAGRVPHRARVQDALVRHGGGRLMSVNDRHTLTNQDVAKQWQEGVEGW